MKTTRAARRYIRFRFTALCVLVLLVAGLELGLAHSFARTTSLDRARSSRPAQDTPPVSMGDFTVAAANVR